MLKEVVEEGGEGDTVVSLPARREVHSLTNSSYLTREVMEYAAAYFRRWAAWR